MISFITSSSVSHFHTALGALPSEVLETEDDSSSTLSFGEPTDRGLTFLFEVNFSSAGLSTSLSDCVSDAEDKVGLYFLGFAGLTLGFFDEFLGVFFVLILLVEGKAVGFSGTSSFFGNFVGDGCRLRGDAGLGLGLSLGLGSGAGLGSGSGSESGSGSTTGWGSGSGSAGNDGAFEDTTELRSATVSRCDSSQRSSLLSSIKGIVGS